MDLSKLSVSKLRTELWTCHILAEQRCLRKACEWAEDLLFALPEEGEEKLLSKLDKDLNDVTLSFNPQYEHAKACFELHEYDRAAHIIRDHLNDDKSRFLHYFSMYKAAEKKRIDLMNEVSVNIPKKAMLKFNELRDSLERSLDESAPDGWLLYVYGLVLQKFRLHKSAVEVIQRAINLTPINWSAWYMLTTLIDSKEQLIKLDLPNHLFKVFFYYMMRSELALTSGNDPIVGSDTCNSIALRYGPKETRIFLDKYFKNSLFVKTLSATSLACQPSKGKEALELFGQIRIEDPYRVDAMEVYSFLLFNRKLRKELARLAYEIERIDPFTSEANSCIANSFSAREQHTKAIVYFTRALRINPDHLNPWALIGHSYYEVKSIEKAIQAYRFALYNNKRDCRAWLGLGKTYETIINNNSNTNSTPNYEPCLYYYSQVGKYRPKDPIMLMSMGTIYEKMGELKEAITCIKRAGNEGLFKLAKLYEANGMNERGRMNQ